MHRGQGDADAGADRERSLADRAGLAERGHELVAQRPGFFGAAHGLEDDDELVAAEAGHQVARSHLAAQALGHLLEQGVAHRVAVGIVDGLEAIEIDHQDAAAAAAALAAGHSQPQVLLQVNAVDQSGQAVLQGQAAEL